MEEMEIDSLKLQNFWKDKKVFLTGHTGFKGSWISLWLQILGADVKGYSLKPQSDPSLFSEAKIAEGMHSFIGDVRDLDKLSKEVISFKPEIVIHMAAQPLVRESYIDPINTYSTNVIGTANLLEACRKCSSIKAVLNITTDKCYENYELDKEYKEDDRLGGHDPYSSSKACSELVTSAYKKSFFLDTDISIATARAGNVIGGGDWSEDRLLPDIIKSFTNSEKVLIRYPNAIRPWQHVLESISGYLRLAQRLYEYGHKYSESWNFGPYKTDTQTVEYIVNKMVKLWGNNSSWELDESSNPYEAGYLKLDITKSQELLAWKPKWNLDEALEKVVKWHMEWLKTSDARSICINQIKDYSK